MIDPDTERLLYDHCSAIPVPKLQAKTAYKQCHHCKDNLRAPNHCRLCGHMYCSCCTCMHHLPPAYKQGAEEDLVPVCYTCRDGVLRERQNVIDKKMASIDRAYVRPKYVPMKDRIIFPPSEWAPIESFQKCAKCAKRGGKPHNCRACGKLFCDTCASKKVRVPDVFKKKTNVTGDLQRVCDECNFLILCGAKLSTTPRPAELEEKKTKIAFDNVINCKQPDCDFPAVDLEGFCQRHGRGATPGRAAPSQSEAKMKLAVVWEGEAKPICQLEVFNSTTLLQIAAQFRTKAPPAVQAKTYVFLCRAHPVPSVFHDIFTAKHLLPQLFIREGGDTAATAASATANVISMVLAQQVNTEENPYLVAKAKKKPEEKKRVEIKVEQKFHAPNYVKTIRPDNASSQVAPPPWAVARAETSTATIAAAPQIAASQLGDIFAKRAKDHFGAS